MCVSIIRRSIFQSLVKALTGPEQANTRCQTWTRKRLQNGATLILIQLTCIVCVLSNVVVHACKLSGVNVETNSVKRNFKEARLIDFISLQNPLPKELFLKLSRVLT